ncbi:MAG: LPS-assembly protein LptD [Proteobacteria bacterium]|nr:LPS-assembly protein LptD [Pseudomonadota bacterium]
MRFSLKPVVLTLLCVFAHSVAAEALRVQVKPAQPGDEPVFVDADNLTGDKKNQVEATGNAVLVKSDQTVRADRLLYDQETGDTEGFGKVVLEQNGNTISGPYMKLNMDTHAGFMEQPLFFLKETGGRGSGDIAHIQDQQHYTLDNATYTTCRADDQDWLVKMSSLEIDRDQQVGTAHNAWIEFMNVPILYSPLMDFPLGTQRRSGFLSPTFGGTNTSGSELILPYYWNIAPNYDATISPRILTKRGVQLNNEFRYLGTAYAGEVHADVLPGDALTNSNRARFGLKHTQTLGGGFSSQINFNRVSDNAYYRDLADVINITSQANLLQDAALNYNAGWWSSSARLQHFQTLQDPLMPVGVPYARLPQLTLNARQTYTGANIAFAGEYVSFSHPTAINGQRLVITPSVSYPLISAPGYYLTPKFTLHSTQYVMGSNNATALPDSSRTLPMFSLDSGAAFERDFNLSGKDYLNTLEPRAFYVYVPYKQQDQLPVFDSGQAPFSFAQMFMENRFVGNDRIGDANQVTLAVISRFLGKDDGAEHLRLSVGERFSLSTPRVNLVAPTTSTNKSDILLAASGNISRAWSLNSELQYSPALALVQHYNITASYRPEAGKVLNLGYRFVSDTIGALIPGVASPTGSTVVNGVVYPTIYGVPYTTIGGNNYAVASPALRQINISGQWPLTNHWVAVGQWNYSFLDNRLLNGVLGVEYGQSCWTLRMVVHSFAAGMILTSAGVVPKNNTGILVQLELNDLIKVGSDPLMLLKQSVPGYTKSKIVPESAPVLP